MWGQTTCSEHNIGDLPNNPMKVWAWIVLPSCLMKP
jgi:hypothetical protein